jgi:hypothetical protein
VKTSSGVYKWLSLQLLPELDDVGEKQYKFALSKPLGVYEEVKEHQRLLQPILGSVLEENLVILC